MAVRFRVIVCVMEKSRFVSFVFSSWEGTRIFFVTLNRFRSSGSMSFSFTIRKGEKKVLCRGMCFCAMGWKFLFSRYSTGLISVWSNLKAVVAKALKMSVLTFGS